MNSVMWKKQTETLISHRISRKSHGSSLRGRKIHKSHSVFYVDEDKANKAYTYLTVYPAFVFK